MLPDRAASSVADWLEVHPGTEIISRDRGEIYADGARQGAPTASHVVDRWHLLKNAGEVLRRIVDRLWPTLKPHVATPTHAAAPPAPEPEPAAAEVVPPRPRRAELLKAEARARRQARYEQVVTLFAQGVSQVEIGRRTGLDRGTIRDYLRAGAFPERQAAPRFPSQLDRFEPYIRSRWAAGQHNLVHLLEELRAQGFQGGYSGLHARMRIWNLTTPSDRLRRGPRPARVPAPPTMPLISGHTTTPPPPAPPSARQVTRLIGSASHDLKPEEQALVARLRAACPTLAAAADFAHAFRAMIRERQHDQLPRWLTQAEEGKIPEWRTFAQGIRREQDAVQAALDLPWSQGPVEGQVNRLKMLKRQMYGRASFAYLAKRFLMP